MTNMFTGGHNYKYAVTYGSIFPGKDLRTSWTPDPQKRTGKATPRQIGEAQGWTCPERGEMPRVWHLLRLSVRDSHLRIQRHLLEGGGRKTLPRDWGTIVFPPKSSHSPPVFPKQGSKSRPHTLWLSPAGAHTVHMGTCPGGQQDWRPWAPWDGNNRRDSSYQAPPLGTAGQPTNTTPSFLWKRSICGT